MVPDLEERKNEKKMKKKIMGKSMSTYQSDGIPLLSPKAFSQWAV